MKKKVVSVVFITMMVVIICLSSINVIAASNDVLGLDSGTVYYIKNSVNNTYLTVPTLSNGTQLTAASFTGSIAQRWILTRQSDGKYVLASALNTGYRMTVSGSTGIISNAAISANQKFTMDRTDGGAYNILASSGYVTKNNSNKIIVYSPYPSGIWSLERVSHGDADIYSFYFQYGSVLLIPKYYDSRGANSTFLSKVSSMGYTGFSFVNLMAANPYSYLKSDDIWVHHGHGNTSQIIFQKGMDSADISTIKISALPSSYTSYNINSLATNSLHKLRVLITTGCYSGLTFDASGNPTPSNNVIEAIVDRGAHCAIGFHSSVDLPEGTNWIKDFFDQIEKRKTIYESIEHACNRYEKTTGFKDIYWVGDIDACLKH